jgi:hypothetical protein
MEDLKTAKEIIMYDQWLKDGHTGTPEDFLNFMTTYQEGKITTLYTASNSASFIETIKEDYKKTLKEDAEYAEYIRTLPPQPLPELATNPRLNRTDFKTIKDNIMNNQNIKQDAGKLRFDLVPLEMLEYIAEIFTYGLKDHAEGSWKEVEPERYYAAMFRHLNSWRKGDYLDLESGKHHLKHALWNLAVINYLEEHKNDD